MANVRKAHINEILCSHLTAVDFVTGDRVDFQIHITGPKQNELGVNLMNHCDEFSGRVAHHDDAIGFVELIHDALVFRVRVRFLDRPRADVVDRVINRRQMRLNPLNDFAKVWQGHHVALLR